MRVQHLALWLIVASSVRGKVPERVPRLPPFSDSLSTAKRRGRNCDIAVLGSEDLTKYFGFPRCSWAEFAPENTFYMGDDGRPIFFKIPIENDMHMYARVVADYFAPNDTTSASSSPDVTPAWLTAPNVIIDVSCYHYKVIAELAWNLVMPNARWPNVYYEWVPGLPTGINHHALRNKRLFMISTNPLLVPCLQPEPGSNTTFHVLRGDPLIRCNHAQSYLDMPYYVVGEPRMLPYARRRYFMSMVGNCNTTQNLAKLTRHLLVERFQHLQDSFFQCTPYEGQIDIVHPKPEDEQEKRTRLSHAENLDLLSSSIFCLVTAGDAASTRRVPEVPYMGCIPVFIGPPYSFLPFPQHIPWEEISITFHVREVETLKPAIERDLMDECTECDRPSMLVGPQHMSVERFEDIERVLRSLPTSLVKTLLRKIAGIQQYLNPNGLVEDVVEDYICSRT